jgi:hypothetical protein
MRKLKSLAGIYQNIGPSSKDLAYHQILLQIRWCMSPIFSRTIRVSSELLLSNNSH